MARLLIVLITLFTLAPVGTAADPLALMPEQATLILKVEKPRSLVEGVRNLDLYDGLKSFPQFREALESTQIRRFFQLVSYLERELGHDWPTLLDKLAGDGIALGTQFGDDNAPALLIIQGTDDRVVEKFYGLMISYLEEQAGRDGSNTLKKSEWRGMPLAQLGKDASFARAGAAILISSKQEVLHMALALAKPEAGDKAKSVLTKPTVAAAHKLAGGSALAWGWLDLATIKKGQQAKDFFDNTRKDIVQTLIAGGTIDVIRRSDFLTLALEPVAKGYRFSVRFPAKSKDLDEVMRLHVPTRGVPGSLPLLKPDGVIYSQSFYLDLAHLWKNRKKMFNEQNLKDVEKGIQDINKVLPGTTMDELLEESGPYHRVVVAYTGEKLYKQTPGQPVPPAALVLTMRDAKFGESMNALLRAGALIAGFQTGWKMSEESFENTPLVSYRFPETGMPKFSDPENLRFNFAPTFAIVDRFLIVGGTPEIVKRLIPTLKKESLTGSHRVWVASVETAGLARYLGKNPESLVTSTVLTQGVSLEEGTRQIQMLMKWLATLGQYNISMDHGQDKYEFRIDWTRE